MLGSYLHPIRALRLARFIKRSGAIAYYPLNEGDGTTAYNNALSTRGTLNGARTGTTLKTQGLLGRASLFNGAGDEIVVTDNNSLDFTTGMSAVVIANLTSLNPYPSFFTKLSGNDGYEAFADRDFTVFGFKIGNGVATVTVTSTTLLSFDTTYMIGFSYDKTALRIFLNGVQDNTANETNNITANTTDLGIGGVGADFTDGNNKGWMQHMAFWNTALTAAQFLKMARIAGKA